MQIPRPYLVKLFNWGCPDYHLTALIMWTPTRETALSCSRQVCSKSCPIQPRQFFTAEEATVEDQIKYKDKTYHGYKKVKGMTE